MEAPIGEQGLIRQAIDPLRRTMIDTVYWQLNTDPYFGTATSHLTDWFSHPTKVGPQWGAGRKNFKTAGEWRIYENAREMIAKGTDPPAVVVRGGHQAGLDVFLSLRFNDGHDHWLKGGLEDPNMSPIKRRHPDWLLGRSVGDYSQFAYNFGLAEVRRYRMDVVAETIAHYDLDGFDFDFCRWPVLFRKGEGERGAAFITDMLRETRRLLARKAETAGRRLYLSVRVPYDLSGNLREGMDVAEWVKEGVVDIVVVAGRGGGWDYRLPIEEFRKLPGAERCHIVAQNLDGFKEARPRSAYVLFGERDYYSDEMHRAVAARHWQAGAGGIFLWNQDWLKFVKVHEFQPQSWKELGDAELLARLDKHYVTGPAGRGGSLPKTVGGAGDEVSIDIDIADSFEPGGASAPAQATLRIMVEHLTSLDHLIYELNGHQLDSRRAVKRYNYNDCWLDFDAREAFKRGSNRLHLAVQSRNSHVDAPLAVRSVEAIVRYRAS